MFLQNTKVNVCKNEWVIYVFITAQFILVTEKHRTTKICHWILVNKDINLCQTSAIVISELPILTTEILDND